MEPLLAIIGTTIQFMSTGMVTLIVIFATLRGSRNSYVGSSVYVLDSFSLHPTATGEESFIQMSGRHKGFVSWLMALFGFETRLTLNVGAREWLLRAGSFAGMHTTNVPLGHVEESICGYQRSLVALSFTTFFSLNSVWTLFMAFFRLTGLLAADSESAREHAAATLSAVLGNLLFWAALAILSGLAYYFSKRIAFAVRTEHTSGFIFKRSFIGNHVVDMAQMEEAGFLLNRLVRAAYYGEPGTEIPNFTPRPQAEGAPLLRWWMLAGGYGVTALAFVLFAMYGYGVNLAIHTAPANTAVFIDKTYAGRSDSSGLLLLNHVTRETHSVQYQAEGYQVLEQMVKPGTFETAHDVKATLALMRYPVRLYTTPAGVHVSVDGQLVGTTNTSGFLLVPSIERGRHVFSAALDGYRNAEENILVDGQRSWRVNLITEAEAARQQAAAQQQEIAAHIGRGRALFQQSQYAQALDECAAALKLDPGNAAALALQKQIEQTRKILGQ